MESRQDSLFGQVSDKKPQEMVGVLERVTFHNPENGFLVGRFCSETDGELCTVTGVLPDPREGQRLQVCGCWEEHARYGAQFAAQSFLPLPPNSCEGMVRYLSSGFKGIGVRTAERIVKAFGEQTFDVIDQHPERLNEVPKLRKPAIAALQQGWETHRQRREVLLFLHSAGLSPLFAQRIHAEYGEQSLKMMQQHPYQLALEVQGIGFRSADALARHNGLGQDHPQRLEAGLFYAMEDWRSHGHTAMPHQQAVMQAAQMLEVPLEQINQAAARLCDSGHLKVLQSDSAEQHLHGAASDSTASDSTASEIVGGREAQPPQWLQLSQMERTERELAQMLARLAGKSTKTEPGEFSETIKRIEKAAAISLSPQQQEAIQQAFQHRVLVITGGPGTGKTTIVRFILALSQKQAGKLALCAPTGKAAKQLSQAAGHPAQTIHRLLEASHQGFARNRSRPLEVAQVIVDESSMLDTTLMHALLRALPAQAHLIMVGDVDQLPSVGPGRVLDDLLSSRLLPAVRLETIFRQARSSRIILNAHAVRKGRNPSLANPNPDEPQDFFFIPAQSPQEAADKIRLLVLERIPRTFRLNPRKDIQVLAPMRKGLAGVEELNLMLQQALNPHGQPFRCGNKQYRVGDRILQTKNDYENQVFNGDIGEITSHHPQSDQTFLNFDGSQVVYQSRQLESCALGYATTVHKAQGSEYPAVITPMVTQHAMMLQRNLLYTAITRAKQLAILVGSPKAIGMAVHNARPLLRHTVLPLQLKRAFRIPHNSKNPPPQPWPDAHHHPSQKNPHASH